MVFHNICYIFKLVYICKLSYDLQKPYIILNIKSYIFQIVENIFGNYGVIIVNCELNAGVRIGIPFKMDLRLKLYNYYQYKSQNIFRSL